MSTRLWGTVSSRFPKATSASASASRRATSSVAAASASQALAVRVSGTQPALDWAAHVFAGLQPPADIRAAIHSRCAARQHRRRVHGYRASRRGSGDDSRRLAVPRRGLRARRRRGRHRRGTNVWLRCHRCRVSAAGGVRRRLQLHSPVRVDGRHARGPRRHSVRLCCARRYAGRDDEPPSDAARGRLRVRLGLSRLRVPGCNREDARGDADGAMSASGSPPSRPGRRPASSMSGRTISSCSPSSGSKYRGNHAERFPHPAATGCHTRLSRRTSR